MDRISALALALSCLACFTPMDSGTSDASALQDVGSVVLPDVGSLGPDASLPDAASGASAPDTGVIDPMEKYCYPGSELPTCADGSFRFWDRFCLNLRDGPQCTEEGDGRCYPRCDGKGGCAAGSTCGEIMLYRCTHYCGSPVRVCFPGPDVKYAGCEPFEPRDAGLDGG